MSPPSARSLGTALTLALTALAVRVLWLPLERHVFDGHEADYLAAFQGTDWTASTRLYPLLAGAYEVLGHLWGDPRLLLAVNQAAGVMTVVAAAAWARKRWGDRSGVAVGLALALSPVHVFWSASAYNVAIPQALVVGGLALGGWRGAACFGLASAMRLELALLAPALALLGRPKVALGALGALPALPLLEHTAALVPAHQVWWPNLRLTLFLGPLGEPLGLILVALSLTRRSWRLLLAALWVHATAAAFDDYGYRHGLFGGLCLVAACCVGTGWRRWLTLPVLLILAWGTQDIATKYYLPQEDFDATLPELPPPPACEEMMDDPLVENSHWRTRRSPPTGLSCWGEERIHRAWTSRGLHARSARMHALYDLEPVGLLRLPGGPRLIYAVRW